MAEVFGIVATAISLARLVISGAKALYGTISGPHDVTKIRADVDTLSEFVQSLQQELEKLASNPALCEPQRQILEQTLDENYHACHEAKDKLEGLTPHSADTQTSWLDRLKLLFRGNEIAKLQGRLQSCKSEQTNIALNFSH